jgi:hypothetical protein
MAKQKPHLPRHFPFCSLISGNKWKICANEKSDGKRSDPFSFLLSRFIMSASNLERLPSHTRHQEKNKEGLCLKTRF